MKERSAHSPVGRGLEILKDTLDLLSPSRATKKSGSFKHDFFDVESFLPDSEVAKVVEYRELLDVCSLVEENGLVEAIKVSEPPKPFASFGSFRQRHGDEPGILSNALYNAIKSKGLSSEAPAKLGSGLGKAASDQRGLLCQEQNFTVAEELSGETRILPEPIDIKKNKLHTRLQKQRSFSSDIDREEAWERKRDLYTMEEQCIMKSKSVGRCASDCGHITWPRSAVAKSRSRTRSLTDEDLEELRGCIDLGFGFSHDEIGDLRSTLPALDLYYAINRKYNDIKSRSSPVSPFDGPVLERSCGSDSPGSPLNDTWRISSPGDNPNQVKTRLRHWAQAVACSIRQSLSP